MNEKRQSSSIPIYGIGVTWLVFGLTKGFSGIGSFALCAVLSALVFGVLRLIFKGKPVQSEPEAAKPKVETPLTRGRAYQKKLAALNDQIPDYVMTAKLKQVECLLDKILYTVEKQPEKQKQISQLVEYYLPTTVKLLERYVDMQVQNTQEGNVGNAMEKITSMLDSVTVALQKQADALYASDVVDITAEIRVMEKMLAAEGLTEQKDF